jgi:hypothetical protein
LFILTHIDCGKTLPRLQELQPDATKRLHSLF